MATFIIGTIVIGLMIFAAYRTIKTNKASGCSSCSGCAYSSQCSTVKVPVEKH